jgi:hypothetical protein
VVDELIDSPRARVTSTPLLDDLSVPTGNRPLLYAAGCFLTPGGMSPVLNF